MSTTENPNAGQSAVVLDIGGDVGALIVVMPAQMLDVEVEIVPTGTGRVGHTHVDDAAHDLAHASGAAHDHGPVHGLVGEPGAATPHVAVVERPLPNGERVPTLVFASVLAGRYDLYVKPDGPVMLSVDVTGAQVTEAVWPD